MAAPVQLAAIDAGSNAIRLVIARATSPHHIQILDNERAAVRLGHNAFTRRLLDDDTIARAARVFRQFPRPHGRSSSHRLSRRGNRRRSRVAQLSQTHGPHPAKSGNRAGSNQQRRRGAAGLLRREWALGDRLQPRLIFDLGGGSLELNFFQRGVLEHRIGLPLGTIRLMETYSIKGAIDEDDANRLRHHVLSLLRSALPSPPRLTRAIAVACGGNAEALVRIAPGPMIERVPSMNVRLLKDQTWRMIALDVPHRMRVFRVREDRAEVMGIAAIIITTLAKWLDLRTMLVPGVGVREGILLDLVAEQYSAGSASEEEKGRAAEMREGTLWFASRLNYNQNHAEQVARLALSLFDQLRPIHEMGADLRLLLEIGALLHDVGHFINRKAHHRHGEYLIRNGDIPGLRGWRCEMVAALVRYHNSKSEPQLEHSSYAALDGQHRRQARLLTSLLRIAEKLESEHAAACNGRGRTDCRTQSDFCDPRH